jgi:hypothetical protein
MRERVSKREDKWREREKYREGGRSPHYVAEGVTPLPTDGRE